MGFFQIVTYRIEDRVVTHVSQSMMWGATSDYMRREEDMGNIPDGCKQAVVSSGDCHVGAKISAYDLALQER